MIKAPALRIAYNVPVDEEVRIKAHRINDLQLLLQPFTGHLMLPAIPGNKAISSQLTEQDHIILLTGTVAQLVLVLPEVHLHIAAIHQLVGIGDNKRILLKSM